MNNNQYYDKYKRNKQARSFYKSKEWEKCRKLALIRDNYLCQKCLKKKTITAADLVHHIKPLSDFPELSLTLENLESLCNPCHNKEHSEKENKNRALMKRKVKVIAAEQNEEYI